MLGIAPIVLDKPYPFPKWHQGLLIAVEEAVRAAWEHLKDDAIKDTAVKVGTETEITSELVEMLEKIRLAGTIRPFDELTIGKVHSGSEYTNYNKMALQKKPDIVVDLISARYDLDDSLHDAYFIECKVIRENQSYDYYINSGIKKFTDGDYAWAMPNAMMVGYVRNNAELAGYLLNGFARYDPANNAALIDNEIVPCPNSQERNPDNSAFISRHSRTWNHPDYGEPGDIEVTHLWLNCQ